MRYLFFKMNLISRETSFVSLYLYVIYFLLVFLDIITTLLTDINLKYEGNIITNFFVNSTNGFIIYVLIISISSFIITIIADRYFIKLYKYKNNIYRLKLKSFLFSIVLVFFYTHIISMLWVIPNNILHYIGLNGNENWILYNNSSIYVNFSGEYYPWYQLIIQLICIIISFMYFKKKKNQVKRQFQ